MEGRREMQSIDSKDLWGSTIHLKPSIHHLEDLDLLLSLPRLAKALLSPGFTISDHNERNTEIPITEFFEIQREPMIWSSLASSKA